MFQHSGDFYFISILFSLFILYISLHKYDIENQFIKYSSIIFFFKEKLLYLIFNGKYKFLGLCTMSVI